MGHHRQLGCVLVGLLAGGLLVTGCGAGGSAASPTSASIVTRSSAVPSTAASTTSTAVVSSSTLAPVTAGPWDPSALPPCDGLGVAEGPPRWLPAVVPDGLRLADGAARLHTANGPVDPSLVGATSYTLAELGAAGELRSTFVLERGGSPTERSTYDSAAGEALSEVRGRPGEVARWINRGDPYGAVEAAWDEDGEHWRARAQASPADPDGGPSWTPSELAAVLAGLELTRSSVSDPSGRFVVVGRSTHDGDTAHRSTVLSFVPDGSVPGAAPLHVEISERPAGSSGLPALWEVALDPLATVVTVEGVPVASSPNVAVGTVADGSTVRAAVNGSWGPVDGQMQPSWTSPTVDDLRALVVGLVAVAADDPRLAQVGMPVDTGTPRCRDAP